MAKQFIFVTDQEDQVFAAGTSISGNTATISYFKSKVSCDNEKSGTINLISNGTTGNVTYNWTTTNGGGIVHGEKNQTTLADGDYNVKVYENGKYLLELDINIPVVDDEIPVIESPDDITLECNQIIPAAFLTWSEFENAGGRAMDNCQLNYSSFQLIAESKSNATCPFTITRTYQIKDINGNSGIGIFFNTPPVIVSSWMMNSGSFLLYFTI